MYLARKNSRFTLRVLKFLRLFFIIVGVLVTTFIFISGNTLFFSHNYQDVVKKVQTRVLGDSNITVSNLDDFIVFTKGAIAGLASNPTFPNLEIELSQKDLLVINDLSIKPETLNKYSDARLVYSDGKNIQKLKGKIRTKGDRKLHRESITQTSYRLNLKGDDRLEGLEEFSVQRPIIRNYTWEFLIADIFDKAGLLTLKQKVVNLIFNGDSRGLYVVEEVPSVLTVERDSRKNGPIFGLEENYGVGIGSILDVYDKKSWASNMLYEYSKKNHGK